MPMHLSPGAVMWTYEPVCTVYNSPDLGLSPAAAEDEGIATVGRTHLLLGAPVSDRGGTTCTAHMHDAYNMGKPPNGQLRA